MILTQNNFKSSVEEKPTGEISLGAGFGTSGSVNCWWCQ